MYHKTVWLIVLLVGVFHLFSFFLIAQTVVCHELEIRKSKAFSLMDAVSEKPEQVPHSRIAKGNKNIRAAWFGGATDRYRHGILGDTIEASLLLVETTTGRQLAVSLPENRVFEDLEPRLADINGDHEDEVMVVESDVNLGASLAVYSIQEGNLKKLASTPFLGLPNRWLNPVGVGDFDGDGQMDVALVATPHIGGILQLYRYTQKGLDLFAAYSGVSTHRIGSMDLNLGHVVKGYPRDLLLLPDQSHRILRLIEWTPNGPMEVARAELSGRLGSSLIPVGPYRWRFRIENRGFYEVFLKK